MKSSGLLLALSLLLISNATASADGLLTTIVKDTLHMTGGVVDGTVGIAGTAVSGTVDSVGNVIDSTGHIVGRVVGTTPSSGVSQVITDGDGVIMLGSSYDVYSHSIDTRSSDLKLAVDAAEQTGKITNAQANNMRADLARISAAENEARADHTFTFEESLSLARELDSFNIRLANMMSVQPFSQLVALDSAGNARIFVTAPRRASNSTVTSTRTVSDGNVTRSTTTITSSNAPVTSAALYSILDNRRYELDRKIGEAIANGTLTEAAASPMQGQSDHVRILMLDRGHVLTQDQGLKIATELDALDSAFANTLKVSVMTPLTLVDATSGTTRIVSDQFGNVISVSDVGPDIYIKTLEGRRVELENTIAAGQASGSISAAQGRNLRAELDRVAKLQAEEQAGDFSYVSALPLAMSLDYVGSQLITVAPTITYVPLINGSRFAIIGGRVIMLDDVMV